MQNEPGENDENLASKRRRRVSILLVIGVVSILIRLLFSYNFHTSALLYVGIPFVVAILLIYVVDKPKKTTAPAKLAYFCIWSLIVMLGSSIVLFEGFICVVMFMPIYFFFVLLMLGVDHIANKKRQNGKNTLRVHLIPVLIVISAFEGAIPSFEFERDYTVKREIVINASSEAIKAKLISPMHLDVDRNWLLTLFPMPTNINAESLKTGDVHQIDFVYHRWFVTNTHSGSMVLELTEVQDNYIKTTFLEDTSYIGNYLDLKGTEIRFVAQSDGTTKVSLSIHYHRTLDPVWYFGPLQEYAISKMAELLLSELFVPENIAFNLDEANNV